MKIFIDGDACPVKELIVEVGREYHLPTILVCSVAHVGHIPVDVKRIIVDNYSQATDMVIMNQVAKGDLVVTQDYGLASYTITKGAYALHHSGMQYTEKNMDELLFQRHLSSKIRRSGGKTKGPKPFTHEDKQRFKAALIKKIMEARDESIKEH